MDTRTIAFSVLATMDSPPPIGLKIQRSGGTGSLPHWFGVWNCGGVTETRGGRSRHLAGSDEPGRELVFIAVDGCRGWFFGRMADPKPCTGNQWQWHSPGKSRPCPLADRVESTGGLSENGQYAVGDGIRDGFGSPGTHRADWIGSCGTVEPLGSHFTGLSPSNAGRRSRCGVSGGV